MNKVNGFDSKGERRREEGEEKKRGKEELTCAISSAFVTVYQRLGSRGLKPFFLAKSSKYFFWLSTESK